MARYLLSFVGSQDPYSDKTQEAGPIATLAAQLAPLAEVILLYTADFADKATDTRDWLTAENLGGNVHLWPVPDSFTHDPIDLNGAIAVARAALTALPRDAEILLNGSSGTPTMKSAWPILQAAGYVPNGQVWQVRNPKEMNPDQERVFPTNLNSLRAEFERQVLLRQIRDYNYSGALQFLPTSVFQHPTVEGWLRYGRARLALDFVEAQRALSALTEVPPRFQQETNALCRKEVKAIAWEGYFVAEIHYKTGQIGNFLVLLSALLETVWCAYAEEKTGLKLYKTKTSEEIWQQLQSQEALYNYLQNQCVRCEGWLNRYHYRALVEFYEPPATAIAQAAHRLCSHRLLDSRNDLAHKLQGKADMTPQAAAAIFADLRVLLGEQSGPNPYEVLHREIERHLSWA
ncbi:MAG TPA: hypothetical protein DCQ32_07255 [Cyanobacteria bacterium UBA8156]|jgi:hypothetical protein|nr:hypothetical protein [Cyanobacteria bacterium UBA8156]